MLNILIICIITTTKIYFRRKANIIYIVSNQHIIVVFSSAKTLQISYIGMQTQEVVIKPNLRVVLKADAQKLDEVVVTAMGISREKKALGYAVQDVKSDALTRAANTDLAEPYKEKYQVLTSPHHQVCRVLLQRSRFAVLVLSLETILHCM